MIDMNKVARYIELDDQITLLEKDQDKLKQDIKDAMIADATKAVKHLNRTITLTESTRETVKKDELVKELVKKGLKTCVKIVLEPDMDMIQQAVDSGEITQTEVDSFIKRTPVHTMKLK